MTAHPSDRDFSVEDWTAIAVISFKYEFSVGIEEALSAFESSRKLSPAQTVDLCRTYPVHMQDRLPTAIKTLITNPISVLSTEDITILGSELISFIISVQDKLTKLRTNIAAYPFPAQHDNNLCTVQSDPGRELCDRTWGFLWEQAGRQHLRETSETGATMLKELENMFVPHMGQVCQALTCHKLGDGDSALLKRDGVILKEATEQGVVVAEQSIPCISRGDRCWY